MYERNGNYRRKELVAHRKDEHGVQAAGYPITFSFMASFVDPMEQRSYPELADADLMVMSLENYERRLSGFYRFVNEVTKGEVEKYAFPNDKKPYGQDVVSCPVDGLYGAQLNFQLNAIL
jgi:hypothetical protein